MLRMMAFGAGILIAGGEVTGRTQDTDFDAELSKGFVYEKSSPKKWEGSGETTTHLS